MIVCAGGYDMLEKNFPEEENKGVGLLKSTCFKEIFQYWNIGLILILSG